MNDPVITVRLSIKANYVRSALGVELSRHGNHSENSRTDRATSAIDPGWQAQTACLTLSRHTGGSIPGLPSTNERQVQIENEIIRALTGRSFCRGQFRLEEGEAQKASPIHSYHAMRDWIVCQLTGRSISQQVPHGNEVDV